MDELIVKTRNGYFRATKSADPEYPGIDIEFVSDIDQGENLSRPRVLVEQPLSTGEVRALIWSDKDNEDYTDEIIFDEPTSPELCLSNLEANALDHITAYNHADCWFRLGENNKVYDAEADCYITTIQGLVELHDSIFIEDVRGQLNSDEQEALIALYNRIGYPIE